MDKSLKTFLSNDFLLENKISTELYHQYAAHLPIIDYHNHLPPKDITENRRFTNLTELWLDGDHYKWRAMRANGTVERFCTGNASPEDKFNAWATTVPFTLRNPLYHWTHLELKNYFGIDSLLDESTSNEIYTRCNKLLQTEEYRTQGLLKKMKVEIVCTTDDPIDSLEYHKAFSSADSTLKMYPTFRPDKVYSFDQPELYNQYINKLASASGVEIISFDDLIKALVNRIHFFNDLGCRSADHGLESLWFDKNSLVDTEQLFTKVRKGNKLLPEEKLKLRAAILFQLCRQYHSIGWVQQFHLGALRGNNSRMLGEVGPDTGFDSVGDFSQAQNLSHFLDALDETNQLSKTILYNLNPSHNEVFATMAGNFNDGSIPGKIQFGSAWWFLDQKNGMEKQIDTLSNMGLLSRFVGMITDSRSFLSFPRHEYFRRILCNMIGKDVMNGEMPNDIPRLGKMIEDICYNNAKNYFQF